MSGDTRGAGYIGGMATVAGLATMALLGLVNSASGATANAKPTGFFQFLMFLVAFAIFTVANREALLSANRIVEDALQKLRLRLVRKVHECELTTLENLSRGELFTTLAEKTSQLSQLFPALGAAAQQGLMVAFCALYLLYLSPLATFLAGVLTVALGSFFMARRRDHRQLIARDSVKQAELFEALDHFVDGFKEVRTDSEKSDALQESFERIAIEAEETTVAIGQTWTLALIFTNLYLFALLAILTFLVPTLSDSLDDKIVSLTSAALFAFGPLTTLMALLPLFEQAEAGLTELADLETRLDAARDSHPELPIEMGPLTRLDYRGLLFSYRDVQGEATFTSGPWDLTVRPGELLFIVGGNGSGKSTLMKMLTGLYWPDAGTILLNEQVVEREAAAVLREQFCCIFTDFHLFDRLYGLEHVDEQRVNDMIRRMELESKVTYRDGRFSTTALSTGQRKRLALIGALLEDRPAYVFDEWAADQDQQFRERFYQQILPDLKARGKAVLVVSHDDRYWHVADRILKLEHGLPAQELTP